MTSITIDIAGELLEAEDEDERAVLLLGEGAGPWPAGAGLRLPGEEVRFEARLREWVPPGAAVAGLALVVLALGVLASWTRAGPSTSLLLLALLALLEAARTAWWWSTRYVVTTARLLVLRGVVRTSVGREVSRTRARVDREARPARVVSPAGTIVLSGLDAATVAALAHALDDPGRARSGSRR